MKFNLGKFLVPILTGAIQGQMTAHTPGLSKRDKVIKIASDAVNTLGTSGVVSPERASAIIADGQDVIAQANDLFVKALKLKQESEALYAQGRALIESLKDFGKIEGEVETLE